MLQKEKNDPKEPRVDQLENSDKRPKMKYFKTVEKIQCLESQRIKRRSLEKMIIKKVEVVEKGHLVAPKEKVQRVLSFMKSQKASLKCLKAIRAPIINQNTKVLAELIQTNQKSLQKLGLKFIGNEFSVNGIKLLTSRIRYNLPQLHQLNFVFTAILNFNQWSRIIHTINNLRVLKVLRELFIHHQDARDLTDEKLLILATQISTNPQLRKLNLSFAPEQNENENLTDEALAAFAVQIGANLKQLQQLDLNFALCSGVTDLGVEVLAEAIGENLVQLRQLSLNFRGCRIEDRGIAGIADQFVGSLQELQNLTLEFLGNEAITITDGGVIHLADRIEYLEQIQELKLIFIDCSEITDEGVEYLADKLGMNMKQLKRLYIDFSQCDEITNSGYTSLITQIGSNLTNLQGLNLHLTSNYELDDGGIQSLGFQLQKKLKHLHDLRLDLPADAFSTMETVQGLATGIGTKRKNLQQLSLSFAESHLITDEWIAIFFSPITQNLPQLQQFSLKLARCPDVTDVGLIYLGSVIGRCFQNLLKLSLQLSSSQITDVGLAFLADQFQMNFTQLQKLTLNFFDCQHVTEEGKTDFENKVKVYRKKLQRIRVILCSFSYQCKSNSQGKI